MKIAVRRSFPRLAAVLAACAIQLAAFAGADAQTKAPYTITAILPLTGNLAFIGQQQQKAMQGLQLYVNAHGGMRGRPLAFDFYDDTNNPATTVQLFNKANVTHPAAMIAGGTGATCRALAAITRDAGPIIYCLTPAVQPEHGGYMYSTSVGYDDTTFATMRYFAAKGVKRFAFISTTDASGQQGDLDVELALHKPENRNVVIVDHEKMAIGDISATAQVTKMLAAKPDAILALVTGNAVGNVLRALHDAGNTLPVATTLGNMTFGQMDAYKAFLPAEYLIPAPPWAGSSDSVPPGPLHDAIAKYFEVMKLVDTRPEEIGAALAYDPTLIIVSALQKLSDDVTPAQLRSYLMNLREFAGASGIYNFRLSPNRGLGIGDCILVRWDAANNRYRAVSGPGGNALKPSGK
jgi:branched-chain amino acid transport system substrate-binding protein